MAPSNHADAVKVGALQPDVLAAGVYPLDDVAGGQVNDADAAGLVPAAVNEGGCEERARVACRVILDEERVRNERPPRAADGAEAAEVLGRQPQQDLVQPVRGQRGGAGCVGRVLP